MRNALLKLALLVIGTACVLPGQNPEIVIGIGLGSSGSGGGGGGSGTVSGTTGALAAFTDTTVVGDATVGEGIIVTSGLVVVDSAIIPLYSKGADDPTANCTQGRHIYLQTTTGNMWHCTATNTWGEVGGGGSGAIIRQYGGSFTNSGATIAATVYSLGQRVTAACTIAGWSIGIPKADTGTATVKFVRVAAGTGAPGSGNEINTNGVALSTGTWVYSTTVTDFTDTTLDAGDIVGAALTVVGGSPTGLTAKIYCQE